MSGGFGTLGLLGGMGPGATADVLAKIVEVTPATRDQDHIPIMVRSVPQIPDRSDALLGRGPSPQDALVEGARSLRAAGADFLAIACNTAHHWYEPVRRAAGVPVIHIAEAVLHDLRPIAPDGPIGLLATAGTLRSGFYQQVLGEAGYQPRTPDARLQAESVDRAIALGKAGRWPEARRAIDAAVQMLREAGADVIVLACTELPMILAHEPLAGVRILDANLSLARACVRAARASPAGGPR